MSTDSDDNEQAVREALRRQRNAGYLRSQIFDMLESWGLSVIQPLEIEPTPSEGREFRRVQVTVWLHELEDLAKDRQEWERRAIAAEEKIRILTAVPDDNDMEDD